MDFVCFSEDSFDAVNWINTIFEPNKNENSKDKVFTTCVSRLQIYVEQVNFALEKSSLQVTGLIPHVIKEVNWLQTELELLTSKMSQLQSEIGQIQSSTGSFMSSLERSEKILRRIQSIKSAMQESDGWSTLANELDDLLERKDIDAIEEKFIALQNSFKAQQDFPGQTDRELQIEYFANRIESLISPMIIQCFQTGGVEPCLKYVGMFRIIQRANHLEQCYRTVHKKTVSDSWARLVENCDSIEVLSEFYNNLHEFLQGQIKWCKKVTIDPIEPFHVMIEALLQIQPNRGDFVRKHLEISSSKIETLSNIATIDNSFSVSLKKTTEHYNIVDGLQERIQNAIFSYFEQFISNYFELERSFGTELLQSYSIKDGNITEIVRTLNNTNDKISKWISNVFHRSMVISRNRTSIYLIALFKKFFVKYIEYFASLQKQLLYYNAENTDWSLIQLNVNTLQYLSDFYQIMQDCESKISNITNSSTDKNANADISETLWTDEQLKNNGDLYFPDEYKALRKTSWRIHNNVIKLILHTIEKRMNEMTFQKSQNNDNFVLPDCSYAPQEYVTQIGQYLLTLPQHLEPLLLSPPITLQSLLKFCDNAYISEKPCSDVLLSLVAEEITALYQEKIDNILSLSTSGAKQLAADIEYYENVLEEMSLPASEHFQQTVMLLKVPAEQFNSASTGCSARLVTTIRQKRNILSC
ncbi:conserved oligomeric Golgi complex subunit 7 [Uranotaenia lowii]|uniref:conserved oligomeric Golgi complex subunit 7 n=1 Tax=Uranotaenia lowii TaxID=190385 RepID=UPI00247A2BB9|nr:conserved oligomeric Golgi complex subunit 7 [Uranotaenia lowii]XP_055599574.1 conserved oligomeric Golgi complex subunit 7 [Uranotaenia lowii]XP_055599575.1 conserved oligomeric Golgi complex subunit 7 [Uranotaenia lowii]